MVFPPSTQYPPKIQKYPLTPAPEPLHWPSMNTTQTSSPPPVAEPSSTAIVLPALTPLARAILADWDDPRLSELALARRHGLSLEALYAHSQTPAFRSALALRRRIREDRRAALLTLALDHAAEVLTTLSARQPDTNAAAKEIRLALKDLLRLRGPKFPGAGGILPPDRPQGDASCGADLQSASSSPSPTSSPAGKLACEVPERSEGGGGNLESVAQAPPSPPLQARPDPTPRPNPHKPKCPRGYKTRPKPKSR